MIAHNAANLIESSFPCADGFTRRVAFALAVVALRALDDCGEIPAAEFHAGGRPAVSRSSVVFTKLSRSVATSGQSVATAGSGSQNELRDAMPRRARRREAPQHQPVQISF